MEGIGGLTTGIGERGEGKCELPFAEVLRVTTRIVQVGKN